MSINTDYMAITCKLHLRNTYVVHYERHDINCKYLPYSACIDIALNDLRYSEKKSHSRSLLQLMSNRTH